ncbi:NaeI family type II restriction endonuclease [Streptomyces uncialis]|uniref:NaeI family type II restriction endonuclease n=1 Tax=Streptomyces uncialis TaxID=1048205 RepID=UPI0037B39148
MPLPEDPAVPGVPAIPDDSAPDLEISAVREDILQLDPTGDRFSAVLRETIDQLLDGETTGRYDWKTLLKTEKTHAGTLVEINLQRRFRFGDGVSMDYRIAGVDVDCKFSQQFGGWMIPPEALGHICLLVWADDSRSLWSAGLLRVRREWLNRGNNRDLKLTLSAKHRDKIHWLWQRGPGQPGTAAHHLDLPENVLLHMDPADRAAVFAPASGQARLNELFRRARGRRIGRNVVRTVAQQKDYMKRVRGNGGSRSALRAEGILIMGDYASHQRIASELGVPVPREGEFVSARVVTANARHASRPRVDLDGAAWVLAGPEDPHEPGPLLPKTSSAAQPSAL